MVISFGYVAGKVAKPYALNIRSEMAYFNPFFWRRYCVTTKIEWGKITINQGGKERSITDPVINVPNPVIDGGIPIPNFNNTYTGKAPDVGAFEIGRPPLRFGRRAYNNIWAPWELYAKEATHPPQTK